MINKDPLHKIKQASKKWGLYLVGFVALIWFLIRVIPKPSRAAYPCQRAAFPIASAFVIWIGAIVTTSFLFKKAKVKFREARYAVAGVLLIVCVHLNINQPLAPKHGT